MACSFGDQLLHSYQQAVVAARLSGSSLKHQALADVAHVALLTHQNECRSCQDTESSAATSRSGLPFFSISLSG